MRNKIGVSVELAEIPRNGIQPEIQPEQKTCIECVWFDISYLLANTRKILSKK